MEIIIFQTVRDLLKADELKKLNEENEISSSPTRVQRMTEADLKRRLFEEKLAKEQEERQQKKMTVLKQQKQQEDVRNINYALLSNNY